MSKRIEDSLSGCNIWIGSYITPESGYPILLCVSESKKEVKQYLKAYRGLSKDQYKIIHRDISYGELITHYEKFVISEWNGHHIPAIDQMTMSLIPDVKTRMLEDAIIKLNAVAEYCNDIKQVSKEESAILARAVNILIRFDHNTKIVNKINELYLNEVLFAPIEFHLQNMNITIGMLNLETQWKDAMYYD